MQYNGLCEVWRTDDYLFLDEEYLDLIDKVSPAINNKFYS